MPNTFNIDITDTLTKFSNFFGNSERMILSAKFGDGKTYLLNKFIQNDDPKNPKYYFVVLHPVNYVVEENRDIFEYIKRDILFQILQDDKLIETEETIDAIVKAVSENISISEVWDFLSSLIPIPGFKSIGEIIKKCTAKVSKIRETYQENKLMPYNYVNSFVLRTGSIAECDGITQLIQQTLSIIEQTHQCDTVLIIEDMDRLDPAHMFRILNILGANIDNPYFESSSDNKNGDKERNPNKFGFNKILLVMDYGTSKHIFHHFYGDEADFEGYMQKFLDNPPFNFSFLSEARNMVREKIKTDCNVDDNFFGFILRVQRYSQSNPKIIDYINKLSVRRCKQIIQQDVESLIRKDNSTVKYERSLKVLVYLKLIVSDEYTMHQIYHAFENDIDSYIDVMFPALKEVGTYNTTEYTRQKSGKHITYLYDIDTQRSKATITYGNAETIWTDDNIKSLWERAEKTVSLIPQHFDLTLFIST